MFSENVKKIYFSTNLKTLIKQRNWDQKRFSIEFNIKQTTVTNWVKEISYPNFLLLVRLAAFFTIDLETLVHVDLSNNLDIISDDKKTAPLSIEEDMAILKSEMAEIKKRLEK